MSGTGPTQPHDPTIFLPTDSTHSSDSPDSTDSNDSTDLRRVALLLVIPLFVIKRDSRATCI